LYSRHGAALRCTVQYKMPTIPKYVCTTCGRGFTSARSARRHVGNVESGNGQVVAEEDYRIGLQAGRIPVPIPKQIRQIQKIKKLSMTDIAKEEFLRGYFRRLGEKFSDLAGKEVDMLMMLHMLQVIDQSSDDDFKIFANTFSNSMKGKQK
jgi:hypothetical protein